MNNFPKDSIECVKKLLRIEYGSKPTSESEINNIYKTVFNLSQNDFYKIIDEIESENIEIHNKSVKNKISAKELLIENIKHFGFDVHLNIINYDHYFHNYNLSQDEIDQIIKEIKEDQNQLNFSNGQTIAINNSPNWTVPFIGMDFGYSPEKMNHNPNTEPNGNICNHKMVSYTGLFEQYNHCEKCGQKEK